MTRHTGANSELPTIKDVARELGIGYQLAQKAIRTGQIPSVVIGSGRMVSRDALARWLLQGQPVTPNVLEIGRADRRRIINTGGNAA